MKPETRRRILRTAALWGCAALLFLLLLLVWHPGCPIYQKTGFYCAGCGTQRMILDLLRGDFAGAFSQNPFMFVFLPAALFYLMAETIRMILGKRPLWKNKGFLVLLLFLLAAALVFTVLRNLPGFAFLAPKSF